MKGEAIHFSPFTIEDRGLGMDIGTGIATGIGFGSTALGIVATLYRIFPSKNGNGNGYNAALCKKEHQDINNRFDRSEADKRDIAADLKETTKAIFSTLSRIEQKQDDHIDFHLKNK